MKKIFMAMLLVMLATVAQAADYRAYVIDIVDSRGNVVTDANFTITIQDAGAGTTASTVYTDDQGTAKTNPVTPASDARSAAGTLIFWGTASTYDIYVDSSVYTGIITAAGIAPTDHLVTYPLLETVGNVSAGTGSFTGAVTFGVDGTGVDVTFYGDTASDYIKYDMNGATNGALLCEDNPISMGDATKILFGDALATGDMYIESTSDVLTIGQVAAGTGTVAIGVDGKGIDWTFYGETASDFVKFDQDGATNGALQFEDCPISMGDATKILFGDALNTGDMYIECTSNVLTIGQVVAGTGDLRLGVNDAGVDFTLFGDTASQKAWWDASGDTWYFGADAEGVDVYMYADTTGDYFMFDESDEAFEGIGVQIHLDDDSKLELGTDKDWYAQSGTAKTLSLIPGSTTDETAIINIGANTAGADLKVFGATTGSYITYDASADSLILVGSKMYGEQKNIITTTTTPVAVTAANSGSVYVSYGVAAGAADCVFTLPACAAGLTYTLVDANATAADDLWVTAGTGDAINGGTAAKSFKNTGDVYGASVVLIGIDATNWIAIPGAIGTWANDNN